VEDPETAGIYRFGSQARLTAVTTPKGGRPSCPLTGAGDSSPGLHRGFRPRAVRSSEYRSTLATVCDGLEGALLPFSKTSLVSLRATLMTHRLDHWLIERTLELVERACHR
jgi:hypothetical protein